MIGPDPRGRPRWYRERTPIFWWLRRWSYVRFIVRELTSVFVAYAAVLLLVQMRALAGGAESWARFQEWLREPWILGLHAVVLLMLLYHSVTWLGLAPRALVLRVGGRRVPDGAILAGHYLAWAVLSALLVLALAGGGP